MDFQISDIILFLVSGTACLYCIVLSQRLRALHDMKHGIGASIVSLSNTISALSTSSQATKLQSSQSAQRLVKLLEDADRMCNRIEALSRSIEDKNIQANKQINSAQAELSEAMGFLFNRSHTQIMELSSLLKELRSCSDNLVEFTEFQPYQQKIKA